MSIEINLREINLNDLNIATINIQMLLELHYIYKEKDSVIKSQNYVKAASLRDRELELIKKLESESGYKFSGYTDESIITLLRELKIKGLLNY